MWPFQRWSPARCETTIGSAGSPGSMVGLMNTVGLGGFVGKLRGESDKASTEASPDVSKPITKVSDSVEAAAPVTSPVSQTMEATDSMIPIQYEQFSKEYTQLSGQDSFDGFRLEAQKSVTNSLQTSHSLFLGTTMRETGYIYQFGPTFALDDGRLFLMGRYGNDGCMMARALTKIGKSSEARISASSSLDTEQRNMFELVYDYSSKDWTTSFKTAWQGTWILNTAFSQIITPKLQMGGDFTWIAANGATIGSAGLRYRNNGDIFSSSITRQPNFKSPTGLSQNTHSCKMQYFRKVSDRLSLGTEYEFGEEKPGYESALRFGYEYLFRQARIQGMIDTTGKVSVCAQDATGFGISGMIDYWKSDYRFGFMMQVVPQPMDGTGLSGGKCL